RPGGTNGRFDQYRTLDSGGQPVRGSSYLWPSYPYNKWNPEGVSKPYDLIAQGFDLGTHVYFDGNCDGGLSYTRAYVIQTFQEQIGALLKTSAQPYPDLPYPSTNRTHCVDWRDFHTQADADFLVGIRLDTTYYWWFDGDGGDQGCSFSMACEWPAFAPGKFPGLFTGSGLPMRFAKSTGELIDVYQATTQMTDQSQQCYYEHGCQLDISNRFDNTVRLLLDRAKDGSDGQGPGYYGIFTVN